MLTLPNRQAEFRQAFAEKRWVTDGAMATMLFAKGASRHKPVEELNLTLAALVRDVHREYLAAGAEILRTNTFGANRIRLAKADLAAKLTAINGAAVRIAREVAQDRAFVAGTLGPTGVDLAPVGRLTEEDARHVFQQQAAALAGVDLFILETFRSVAELRAAVEGVRAAAGDEVVIVAHGSVEDDGRFADGTPVERYGPALDALAADAVGVNCSSGPYAAVNALEQLRKSTSKPLSLIPGAGWGRIYSPEYFARSVPGQELAIVGGCCGTTPEHIAALKGEHAPANRIVGQVTGIESSGPGAEPMLTIDAHGRSARELQQRLLELHECGHRRIVCRSRCRASDIDAVGLVHLAASLNRGEDLGGNPITPTQFSVGFAVNLDGDDLERAATAGAQFAITEPVFDVARFDALLQRSPIPVIATLRPVMDPRTADYLVNERGISIPQDVLDRIAAGEGEAVVRELAEALRPLASGLHVTFG